VNYRHAYHAGNFADVLKHAAFALVIERLKLKPAPFRVLDTHAGRGRYDLSATEAMKTGEWIDGIGRLLAAPVPEDIVPLLAPYLSAIEAAGGHARMPDAGVYPGSPMIAAHLMRPTDRLIANELHGEDCAALEAMFAGDRRVKVTTADAWSTIRAHLPPLERRGVILIDPPFEEPGEFNRIVQGLSDALRRFKTGIVMVWYPIKDERLVGQFRAEIEGAGYDKVLDVELRVTSTDVAGLAGCGLIIANPPFGLDAKLEVLVAFLAVRLGLDDTASAGTTWLARERAK